MSADGGPVGERSKACLVTGAASGLGRAVAIGLARAGHRVALGDIDGDGVRETARLAGEGSYAQEVDVTEADQVRDFVDRAAAHLGGLDCAVNSAAVEGPRGDVAEVDAARWLGVVNVNVFGVFLCMKYEIARMAAGGGSIVNIGSTSSLRGVPAMSGYVTAKHALVGLTKTAALEEAHRQIRINLLCPASFHTPMTERLFGSEPDRMIADRTPLRRPGSLDEIAAPVLWLCSDASSFVTGAVISVDGGRMAGDLR